MMGAALNGKEPKERVDQALERSAQSVFAPAIPIQKPWEVGAIRSGYCFENLPCVVRRIGQAIRQRFKSKTYFSGSLTVRDYIIV